MVASWHLACELRRGRGRCGHFEHARMEPKPERYGIKGVDHFEIMAIQSCGIPGDEILSGPEGFHILIWRPLGNLIARICLHNHWLTTRRLHLTGDQGKPVPTTKSFETQVIG